MSPLPPSAPAGRARLHTLAGLLALPLWAGNVRASEALKRLQSGGGEPIAVLFPDIGEPYRKHFAEIIEGVEDLTHLRARPIPLGPETAATDINLACRRYGSRVLIALGARALKLAAGLELPFVLSGVNAFPDGERQIGISFTPDPALLFGPMRTLLPALKRIQVVHNPAQSDYQIRLAREAARGLGLELLTLEARDLAGAARLYEQSFSSMDGRREALWLLHDSTTVEEATILPLVLKEAWNRSVPVFSNSFSHVRKGALFAVYPNNAELGRSLAQLAVSTLAGEAKRGMLPLRDVFTALNTRTASHVGLNLSAKQLRSYDFVYPES